LYFEITVSQPFELQTLLPSTDLGARRLPENFLPVMIESVIAHTMQNGCEGDLKAT
jgi:hypothetical protein